MSAGYGHPGYAMSLAEFGEPRLLPRSGGWVLERAIPGTDLRDAMGCYPLFCCEDWRALEEDLNELAECDLVSLSVVADPFGPDDPSYLRRCFKDVVIPFKEHYVIDLHLPVEEVAGRRHRKNGRRALKEITVEELKENDSFASEWMLLYNELIKRHHITGIQAFSYASFIMQLDTPGTTVLKATCDGETVGAQVYFTQNDVVHCHLGAVNEQGYAKSAFLALDFYSIGYFADKARWLNLGGGAGLSAGEDGLSRYKQGWSTGTRMAYFCGRIFDRERYDEIAAAKGSISDNYFPVYRKGEFH